ncbi:hypothetical protein IRJ41_007650 [Triplophysa rosa]|uniref:Uncharacterized protein n=1 Tax=Triplophysa rosa TaxID=992332 RepID=A0A9W7T7C2_TRIRA|nr:hypothetical protein IRJ41_007650 [Triplophysa rosa]
MERERQTTSKQQSVGASIPMFLRSTDSKSMNFRRCTSSTTTGKRTKPVRDERRVFPRPERARLGPLLNRQPLELPPAALPKLN